jgi:hypothetical protein
MLSLGIIPYSLQFHLDNFYGVINYTVKRNLSQTCFYEALTQAVTLSPYNLKVNQLTVALYIENNHFSLFDSHQ